MKSPKQGLYIVFIASILLLRMEHTDPSFKRSVYINTQPKLLFEYLKNPHSIHEWLYLPGHPPMTIQLATSATSNLKELKCKGISRKNESFDCTLSIYKENDSIRRGLLIQINFQDQNGKKKKYVVGIQIESINGISRMSFTNTIEPVSALHNLHTTLLLKKTGLQSIKKIKSKL